MVHQSQRRWSCDRCHASKERCCRTPGRAQCERCARLRYACQSDRPHRNPGRPRRDAGAERAPSSSSSSSSSSGSSIVQSRGSPPTTERIDTRGPVLERSLSVNGDLSGPELRLLDRALADKFNEQFLLGPGFCEAHRRCLASHLFSFKPVLKDAFLAVALAWEDDGGRLDDGFRRASAALASLCSFQVRNRDDVSVCLLLGGVILTFAYKVRVRDVRAICSQTLNLVKPVYDLGCVSPHLEGASFLYELAMSDMAECLFRTSAPTLRIRPPPTTTQVDSLVGLCVGLLPHLYDLCELSHAMRHGAAAADVAQPLLALELAIRGWRPRLADALDDRFSASEVAHLICQAQVMRIAALIVLHRLRYPFWCQDEAALALAYSILSLLDMTLLTTGSAPRSVDLALSIACLELHEADERACWLRNLSPTGRYSTPFFERTKQMLDEVWAARRVYPNLYWYNLGDILKFDAS
ncbi:hypothetical protein CDD83_2672 [Cordyceps sp. RAO-2017]|nr:hypothetical protein CDD83_2672 [Cordyceps sp. RAO-2017]